MDINLDTLKTEILDYLGASEFAVYRAFPGFSAGPNAVAWDSETFPDYRMYLEAARKAGQKMIVFAAREFTQDDLEEAEEELTDVPIADPDTSRDYKRRLREAKRHVGSTCTIEMSFDYNLRSHVYEVTPDWYDEFTEMVDEVISPFSMDEEEDEEDGHDALGGFYSNN